MRRLGLGTLLLLAGCRADPIPVGILPSAERTERAPAATTVMVVGGDVFFDGTFVQDTAPNLQNGRWAMPTLETHLDARYKELERSSGLCTWLPSVLCNDDERRIDANRIRIAISSDTPYIVVKKILFAANKSGYTRFSFLVTDDRGRVRRLALGNQAPCVEWDESQRSCTTPCKRWGPP